jgi:uncharacterized coiled-coil DUF342 family protein
MHQQSKAKIASLEAERDDWRNRATEAQAERDAAREERDAALVRVAELEKGVSDLIDEARDHLRSLHAYEGNPVPFNRDGAWARAMQRAIDSASSAAGEVNHGNV